MDPFTVASCTSKLKFFCLNLNFRKTIKPTHLKFGTDIKDVITLIEIDFKVNPSKTTFSEFYSNFQKIQNSQKISKKFRFCLYA